MLADGGELIIYAPHLKEVCVTHGSHIESVGHHCRDYFLKQWDRFKDVPWRVLRIPRTCGASGPLWMG